MQNYVKLSKNMQNYVKLSKNMQSMQQKKICICFKKRMQMNVNVFKSLQHYSKEGAQQPQ